MSPPIHQSCRKQAGYYLDPWFISSNKFVDGKLYGPGVLVGVFVGVVFGARVGVRVAVGARTVFVGVHVGVAVDVIIGVFVPVTVTGTVAVKPGVGVFVGAPGSTMYWITSFGRCAARLASDVL